MIFVFHIHPHTIQNEANEGIVKLVVKLKLVFEITKALDIFCLYFERNKVWFEANCHIAMQEDLTQTNWLN